MNKGLKYNIVLRYGGVIVCLTIFIFSFFSETALLNSLHEKKAALDKFSGISMYLPIEKGMMRLEADKDRLGVLYERLRSQYNISKSTPMSKLEPQVLKDRLVRREASLRAIAKEVGLELPSSLGLEASDPSDKVYAITRLISLALNAKILKIEAIKAGDAVIKEPLQKSDEIVYRELPITLILTSSSKTLVSFLSQLSSAKDIFVVKNIDIISQATGEGVGMSSHPSKSLKMDMAVLFINFVNLK